MFYISAGKAVKHIGATRLQGNTNVNYVISATISIYIKANIGGISTGESWNVWDCVQGSCLRNSSKLKQSYVLYGWTYLIKFHVISCLLSGTNNSREKGVLLVLTINHVYYRIKCAKHCWIVHGVSYFAVHLLNGCMRLTIYLVPTKFVIECHIMGHFIESYH